MTITATPLAIAFKEPDVPMAHVPDWRFFSEETARVICLRCRVMISAAQWASETCPGEPKET